MLVKSVCKRCHEEHEDEWGCVDDMDWRGIYSIGQKMKKIVGCVRCYAALDDKKKPRRIPIDKGIPTDCPFHLEHVMTQTC